MDQNHPLVSALTRERSIKSLHRLQKTFESFSLTEKVIFLASAAVFAFASFSMATKVSNHFMVDVPSRGGSLSEGIVGTPRFINPLLATSDADKDLSFLIYSGLLKATPSGEYVPDLAERYEVSPDGLTYSFVIRSDAKFHDGTPVTADDVEFTVLKAEDNALKSPKRVNWEGVTMQKTGTNEISFTLKQPYAPFIANLTLGILPKHIWKDFESDQFPFSSFNIEPIGSGPYLIESVTRGGSGIPRAIVLKANPSYASGEPYISRISFEFFQNDKALAEALEGGRIESASNLNAETVYGINASSTRFNILRAPLTRVFGLFFNQNSKEILVHKEVRKALEATTDKQTIINDILYGYARETAGPLPATTEDETAPVEIVATSTLAKAGWKKNPVTGTYELKSKAGTSTLSFSISTANIPDLVQAAKSLQEDWNNFGASVDIKVFEPSDLNQSVIRPRKYEALLFGMVTGRTPDLYPFWHSSQRNDPGLNIAMYANRKVDALLESMRQTMDSVAFKEQYAKMEAEIANDTPAIFLWSPDFIYVVPKKLGGVSLGLITNTSDRFLGIEKWYVEKDRIWEILTKDNIIIS